MQAKMSVRKMDGEIHTIVHLYLTDCTNYFTANVIRRLVTSCVCCGTSLL